MVDVNCDFCHRTIRSIEPRFYVAYSGSEAHREDWGVILTLCTKCFGKQIFHVVKEGG